MGEANRMRVVKRCLSVGLVLTTVCACEPKVYPEAEPEVVAVPNADGDPGATAEPAAGEESIADGAGAGSTEAGGSDAGELTPVASPTCVPVTLYRDLDGDGFGGTAPDDLGQGCPPLAGFATQGGDCHDAEPSLQDPAHEVYPGQPQFFVFGYPTAGGISFDYDCSGVEEAAPDERFVAALADCAERAPPCGADLGYRLPSAPRTGAGVNPLCGTSDRVNCSAASASTCALVSIGSASPFACH